MNRGGARRPFLVVLVPAGARTAPAATATLTRGVWRRSGRGALHWRRHAIDRVPSRHRPPVAPHAATRPGGESTLQKKTPGGFRSGRVNALLGRAVRNQGRLRSGPDRPRRASCFPRVLLAPGSTSTPGQAAAAKVRQAYGRPAAAMAWPLRPGPRHGRRHVSVEGIGFDHSRDRAAAQACGLGMSSRCGAPRRWHRDGMVPGTA